MKLVIIVGIIVAVLLMPLAYIWALNTLFPALEIPMTWEAWLAMVVVGGVFYKSQN